MACNGLGSPATGKSAFEKKNSGMTRKFMMSSKPCISSKLEAMAVPMAVNRTAIRNMNSIANGKNNAR